ncbi:MAG: chemotaxis protein CheW [Candidatus Wallbacteria bacterium]|nr:chemotaxis protein CheW [Candidatus Wallbacteria bacterium]
MAIPHKATRGSLRPILEQLEELVIEAGLTGLAGSGEAMALQLDDLASRLEPMSGAADAAAVATQTATTIRRILSQEQPRPHGFSERLLETLAVFSDLAQGEDVSERVAALGRALAPQPAASAQPLPPPPDVGRLFILEATGCLDNVEQALLDLERGSADAEPLRDLARDLHNLKGSAGMSGHEDVVELSHAMENQVLGLLSDPNADRARVIDSLLKGLDEAKAIVERLNLEEAAAQEAAASAQTAADYLCFEAGGKRLAVRLAEVARVERVPPSTPVPFTPPFVLGLVNLGGELLPMVDLALRLGFAAAPEEPRWVLVVGKGEERIALRVDKVAQIVTLGADRLSALPESQTAPELPLAAAIDGEASTPVLDARRIAAWLGTR